MLTVLAVLAGACGDPASSPPGWAAPPVDNDPVVYVAIGASETAGVGTSDPFTEAWPKVLWARALPEAVLYDLGRPGSTLSEALVEQAGEAVALQPDVVTVWLNVNDLVAQVPADVYERDLRSLLSPLTEAGATVLVATTPRIDSLPIYLACRPDPPPDAPVCPAPGLPLPPPSVVRSSVAGYNRAIERVAAETGAIVVDLQRYGDAPVEHPEWIAEDGFHPSTEGAEAIAQAFVEALPPELTDAASAPR
jgi:acyl-CoA thioesterase I